MNVLSMLRIKPESLEEMLENLAVYGNPMLRQNAFDTKWYCMVELFGRTGRDYSITSEFGHPTPLAAVKQCYQRVIAAMEAL